MKKTIKFLCVILSFTILVISLNGCNTSKSKKWKEPMNAEIKNLGVQVTNSTFHAAAVTKDKNGEAIGCILSDGSSLNDANLVIVNLNTFETKQKIPLGGAKGGWGSVTATDGKVYFGTYGQGIVFCYDPISETLKNLGRINNTETWVFSLTAGNNGVVYGGTYPNCMIFKITPDGKKTTLLSNAKKGEDYIRSTAYAKDLEVFFGGIGAHAGIVMYDEKTEKVVDILPEKYLKEEFTYDMCYSKGYLLARVFPSNTLLIFKITRDKKNVLKAELIRDDVGTLTAPALAVDDSGKIIYCSGKSAYIFDPLTAQVEKAGFSIGNPNAIGLVALKDQENFPDKTIVSFTNSGNQTNIYMVNQKTKKNKSYIVQDAVSPTNLRSIICGPDNKIYSSGYLVGGLGVYTPGAEKPLGEQLSMGQCEGICNGDGSIYFGVYPGARIYSYDPLLPYLLGTNPKQIVVLKENLQDRPFGMAYGENKVFIGTLPDYGKLDGAFSVYDVPTGTSNVLFPVGERSVTNTLYHDGFVYGGTTIWGGGGSEPTEKDAVLLIYDVKTQQTKTIELPKKDFQIIGGLFWGPDNLLWGFANGHLFKYNVLNNKFVYFEEVVSGDYTKSQYMNGKMLLGIDGYVYATNPKLGFICIDPDTMEVSEIIQGGADICQDKDGNLYFYMGPELWSYSRIIQDEK